MASSRPRVALAIVVFSGMLVLSPACATRTKPAAEPAPAAPPAVATPAAPPPVRGGTADGAYRPAAPAPAPLLGHVTRDQVRSYEPWQSLFAEPYAPDPAAIAAIKANAGGVTVLLVMATWCPDSRRELPRFFAIMEGAGIGDAQLTMVGVDRTKKDPEGLTEKWGITRVPTFVFLRSGREIGRVVERTPAGTTLEGEVARLLAPGL